MVNFELSAPGAAGFQLAAPPVLDVEFSAAVSAGGGTPYTGAYEVTPKIYSPVALPTKNKTMREDVTVRKIPQYEVSNDAGGNTLIMGDEYYGG